MTCDYNFSLYDMYLPQHVPKQEIADGIELILLCVALFLSY